MINTLFIILKAVTDSTTVHSYGQVISSRDSNGRGADLCGTPETTAEGAACVPLILSSSSPPEWDRTDTPGVNHEPRGHILTHSCPLSSQQSTFHLDFISQRPRTDLIPFGKHTRFVRISAVSIIFSFFSSAFIFSI